MVDDPSAVPEEFPTEEAQENERLRLFALISELVTWENTTNEEVLNRAREEIRRSWRRCCADNADHPEAAELFNPEKLPGFHDPFAGGGALPLEAQRLGLEAYASDLNPVAVLINKAMIEIPPKFAGMPPVNPEARSNKQLIERQWKGAEGLAEDVRYYGKWMRDEAEKLIGHLYPKVKVTPELIAERPDLKEYQGQELTAFAWIWARTVASPNPAYAGQHVPLANTFVLSSKKNREAYVDVSYLDDGYEFVVKRGSSADLAQFKTGTSAGKWQAFNCLMSKSPIPYDYIRKEGQAGRMGKRLMALVAEGNRERVYVSPKYAPQIPPLDETRIDELKLEINHHPRDIKTQIYGLTKYEDLFSSRQLVALQVFCRLLEDVRSCVMSDLGIPEKSFDKQCHPDAYAKAVITYLSFAIDKCSDYWSEICTWHSSGEKMRNTFGRQAIPMTWDFAEVNPFCASSGSWMAMVDWTWKALSIVPAMSQGSAVQAEAQNQSESQSKVVSTDPPYYDNIGYADLSDFFYIWLRRSLKGIYPRLFATVAVPKANELVATPYRHGSKENAEAFFCKG
jgi:putative DNA methylase